MKNWFVICAAVACYTSAVLAQTTVSNIVVGAGYALPAPVNVAPGQVLTFFVQGVGSRLTQPVRASQGVDLPTSLAGISVTLRQGGDRAVPIFEVRPISTCGKPFTQPVFPQPPCTGAPLTAITVQIPYNILAYCGPECGLGPIYTLAPTLLWVSENGSPGAMLELYPFVNEIHFLTGCDTIFPNPANRSNDSGLPCPPLVIHADGSLVSGQSPARPGEEIVAYATGLGATDPPIAAGKVVRDSASTMNSFLLDFNFRVNAGPAKPYSGTIPYPSALVPSFAGLTSGYVGLYQINFVVPQPPAGLPPCLPPTPGPTFQSNLTVSLGGSSYTSTYDGAGICVSTNTLSQ